MDDVSVTTGGGPNLILNGGFDTGTLGAWNYLNIYGAPFGGAISATCNGMSPYPLSPAYAWCDGATQAYDAIDQSIATTIGDTYTISFYLNQVTNVGGVNPTVFQPLSTNGNVTGIGGNGIDTLVYVGSAPPPPVPEPASMTLLATGLAALGVRRRYSKNS